jgi:hypothetical protein
MKTTFVKYRFGDAGPFVGVAVTKLGHPVGGRKETDGNNFEE